MFSRISAVLQSAVDTIAPPVPLLHDFVYHWRQLMKFYDDSSEALNVPIESTHLPIHLEHMLKALQEEQQESQRRGGEEIGACLEYLLQHRVPDLLASLACADTPSGMRHLGLVFFSRLVTMTSEHLLPHTALHEPVQRMLRLCGQVSASPTEAQEVRLLCVMAAVIGQRPQLSPLFCLPRKHSSMETQESPVCSESSTPDPASAALSQPSQQPIAAQHSSQQPIAVQHSSQEPISTQGSQPSVEKEELTPAQNSSQGPIREQDTKQEPIRSLDSRLQPIGTHEPRRDNLLAEALLRYTDSADGRLRVKACEALLVLAAQPYMGHSLARDSSLADTLALRLAALHREIPLGVDPGELEEIQASWGMDNPLEVREQFPGCRQLANFLSWMDYCDKMVSDSQHEVGCAVVRSLQTNFLTREVEPRVCAGAELTSCDTEEGHDAAVACIAVLSQLSKLLRQCQAATMREGLAAWLVDGSTGHRLRDALLKLLAEAHGEMGLETMRMFEVVVEEPYETALQALIFCHLEGNRGTEGGAASLTELSEGKYPPSLTLAPSNIHQVLEGFLQLLPPFLRSAETEAGYESYLQDAQRQYQGMFARCSPLGWPLEVSGDDDDASSDSRPEADHPGAEGGAMLRALFARLENFPEQEYELNLQLTALLSRLALLPHAGLHETLLQPTSVAGQGSSSPSLGASLRRLAARLAQEAPAIPNLQRRLRATRLRLLGDPSLAEQPSPQSSLGTDQEALLESVVVLEEFCKELAAIAFVKFHLHTAT